MASSCWQAYQGTDDRSQFGILWQKNNTELGGVITIAGEYLNRYDTCVTTLRFFHSSPRNHFKFNLMFIDNKVKLGRFSFIARQGMDNYKQDKMFYFQLAEEMSTIYFEKTQTSLSRKVKIPWFAYNKIYLNPEIMNCIKIHSISVCNDNHDTSSSEAPEFFTGPPKNSIKKLVELGHVLTLNCATFGPPPLSIRWKHVGLKGGSTTPSLNQDHVTTVTSNYGNYINSTFSIDNATKRELGVYACKVSTGWGLAVRSIQLTTYQVYDKPKIVSEPKESVYNATAESIALAWTVSRWARFDDTTFNVNAAKLSSTNTNHYQGNESTNQGNESTNQGNESTNQGNESTFIVSLRSGITTRVAMRSSGVVIFNRTFTVNNVAKIVDHDAPDHEYDVKIAIIFGVILTGGIFTFSILFLWLSVCNCSVFKMKPKLPDNRDSEALGRETTLRNPAFRRKTNSSAKSLFQRTWVPDKNFLPNPNPNTGSGQNSSSDIGITLESYPLQGLTPELGPSQSINPRPTQISTLEMRL